MRAEEAPLVDHLVGIAVSDQPFALAAKVVDFASQSSAPQPDMAEIDR